jgi:C4-type Zn-finger protein
MMAEDEYEPKDLAVTCPHCGDALSVIMEHNPNPMEREYFPNGFECESPSCSATWDLKGKQTQDPYWARFPESFRKPNKRK